MSNFKIKNVKIAGIAACVPKNIVANADSKLLSKDELAEFIAYTGIEERRVSPGNKACTSDLGIAAAEKLLNELKWEKNEVEILVFVSQTSDYPIPLTGIIMQDRLGLSKNCVVFDMPLGGSGYVYGLSVISSFMQSSGLKKGLFIVGDTTHFISKQDKSMEPLFGDAAAVTALVYDEAAPEMFFDLGTDGKQYRSIMIPEGGSRFPYSTNSLVLKEVEAGVIRNAAHEVYIDADVFAFGTTQAPQTVNELLEYAGIDKANVDQFVFHQANLLLNKTISKKLELPEDKVPYSLKHFGNTSSASIPLTMVTKLKNKLDKAGETSLVLCGFGEGLTWATVYLKVSGMVCCNLLEYDL